MTFQELAKTRRSVRKYKPDPLPRESIERCLEAARLAPSACNSQPWRFIVFESNEEKARLAEAAFSGLSRPTKFAAEAPVLVAVVRDKAGYLSRLGGHFRDIQFSLIDIGIAGEHFILQAVEEGIGTCWIGWFNGKKVHKFLQLPKDSNVDILISMGYPADEAGDHEKKRKPLDEIREYR